MEDSNLHDLALCGERPSVFVRIYLDENYSTKSCTEEFGRIAPTFKYPWRRDTPKEPGWCNASVRSSLASFRYWNGSYWSEDVVRNDWEVPLRWQHVGRKRDTASSVNWPILWRNVKPYREGDDWEFLRSKEPSCE